MLEENLKKTVQYLLSEYQDFSQILPAKIFDTYTLFEKYQTLVNIRPAKIFAKEIEEDFFKYQDAFLEEYNKNKGIIDISKERKYTHKEVLDFCPTQRKEKCIAFDRNIILWQGDITKLKVDAIVNAANEKLLGCFFPLHKCIDNIIHTHAGVQLRLACQKIMHAQARNEETGKAKITKAYNLPAKHVIHTVGPIILNQLTDKDCALLRSSYRSCLEIAQENSVESIAFCCISTGEFRFPQDKAAQIAIEEIKKFQNANNSSMQIIFNVFKDEDYAIYLDLLSK